MATLLHYREWRGEFRRPMHAIWPIARFALRMVFRRRLFWWLYAAGLLLFLMFFFGGYLLEWAQTQMTSSTVKFKNMDKMVRFFRNSVQALNGSQYTYLYFFRYQGTMVMVLLAFAGSVVVGADFTSNSVPFYLSKPMTRWHYIAGKCLAVGVLIMLMTTLPALALYIQFGFSDWEYFMKPDYFGRGSPAGWQLLLGVVGFGMVLTVFLSVMLVAAAAWAKRTMPLVLIWTSVFMFMRLLAAILVNGLRYSPYWRLIDLWNNLILVGSSCLQLSPAEVRPRPQPPAWSAALVLFGVFVVCLIYLNRKIRAVDVVR